jgi:hypothetical protein
VANGQIMAFAATSDPVDVAFNWQLTGSGSLANQEGQVVQYMAPPSVPVEEQVVIVVTVTDPATGCKATSSVTIELLPPPTTAVEPAAVTETITIAGAPVSVTETTTIVEGPTQAIAPTPLTPPLEELFPQAADGEAFRWRTGDAVMADEYAPECGRSGPSGLQLTYEMPAGESGGWGVHWDDAPAEKFDASPFEKLVFWVKGVTGDETFAIGLKDNTRKEIHVQSKDMGVVVSASEWTMVSVPLSEFAGVQLDNIENVNFGFNENHRAGSICIDDIAFVGALR